MNVLTGLHPTLITYDEQRMALYDGNEKSGSSLIRLITIHPQSHQP